MNTKIGLLCTMMIALLCNSNAYAEDWNDLLKEELSFWNVVQTDTIPITDRDGDFTTEEFQNPFDIYPSDIERTIEYDPESDLYIIKEKIGDEYFRMPSYMTFEEYIEYKRKEEESSYFGKLSGFGSDDRGKSGLIDPMSRINIKDKLADRLFGGQDINIKPQGNIDITLGTRYNFTNNGINPTRRIDRWQIPLFQQNIKINVDGNIGDKMDLGFNYDTQATFDFDRKIKLAYDSEEFSEDDIIKKIEAGNVSLPLRSNLIQGSQSLFGLKTELQFGHLTLTAIASQQRSKPKKISVQNGATVQQFELRPDDYDENRHFFISHYHRNVYEDALSNLPHVLSPFKIANIEVWISDDRQVFEENSTMIAAIADLGEPDSTYFSSEDESYFIDDVVFPQILKDVKDNRLPSNRSNLLMGRIEGNADGRLQDQVVDYLSAPNPIGENLKQTQDFETFRGRMLTQSEYTFNPELGFISLNIRLQPNQVLGVSYEYFYTQNCDEVYRVGELATDSQIASTDSTGMAQPESVLYVKMLKSSNQQVDHPTWDLMMKNVYALRTSNLTQEDFTFDIFYENDVNDGSLTKFIPEEGFNKTPLLNIFNLDNLNTVLDPQPDGVFDFVPGITVIPRNGAIIFPVLEPFGESLEKREIINGTDTLRIDSFYIYKELYDKPVVIAAQEDLHKNKFVMLGEYKSSTSSEINLGSWNIPRGSVRVTAGGRELLEGSDYEVDYGIGRLRILNEAYLQQGVPLDIQIEDQSFFSLQQKGMLGLRADYEVSENFQIGATVLKLRERPFTQKVNVGDDPINNTVYGLDVAYQRETPWITKALDALPIYSTNAASSVNVSAEVAHLRPGHNKQINLSDEKEGVVNIDDFEGAVTGLPLGTQPFAWQLASVPQDPDDPNYFPEGGENGLLSGVNRAALSWYIADINARSPGDASNPYSRGVLQTELFMNRQIPQQFQRDLFTFDLVYDPTVRGPYNFDEPGGTAYSEGFSGYDSNLGLRLAEPDTRWAGIMRYINTNDFQAANYEFIDFWMLDPFMEQAGYDNDSIMQPLDNEVGMISFHLGNISEDILKDGKQFYENAISIDDNAIAEVETEFGQVPLYVPTTGSFDIELKDRQDLGLDGINNNEEIARHEDWVNRVSAEFGNNIPLVENDPAGDTFAYFGDQDWFMQTDNLVNKYRYFSNPEGNSPDIQNNNINIQQGINNNVRGKFPPDSEELNGNNSLDQSENYYKYDIKIERDMMNGGILIDPNNTYITDSMTVTPPNDVKEKWYRFRIPIQDIVEEQKVGNIEGFRSIQFMRMVMSGFSQRKIFRMAEFELVRSQWRKAQPFCNSDFKPEDVSFNMDIRGVEENSNKQPFNYIEPPGIQREVIFNSITSTQLDEKSLSLNMDNLGLQCEVAVNKLTNLDLRLFKRLQLFVHAEELLGRDELDDGDLELFVKIGKDFLNNYYEYKIPLVISSENEPVGATNAERVWRDENMLDIDLQDFVNLKRMRDQLGEARDTVFLMDALKENHEIGVIGTPSLGFIKGIEIGVRNIRDKTDPEKLAPVGAEVWVNELRAVGLDERGGTAALARVDVTLADLGNLTLSGRYNSIGWGSLDQRLMERSQEENIDYDVATSLELGKLLPSKWGVRVPFYAQYVKSISNPRFHPFDSDVEVPDKISDAGTDADKEKVRSESQTVTTIKTYNFTNVKKERSKGKSNTSTKPGGSRNTNMSTRGNAANTTKDAEDKEAEKQKRKEKRKSTPKPWDVSNFSVSYGYTETDRRDPFVAFDNTREYRGALDYTYSRKVNYIQPFKKVKSKHLAIVKEFNFNLVPNSFSFSTTLDKKFKKRRFRLPEVPVFEFDEKNFAFERRYDLKWDFTKALSLRFNAVNSSFIDELRQVGIEDTAAARDWEDENGSGIYDLSGRTYNDEISDNPDFVRDYWRNNLWDGGRDKNYSHQINLNYTLPIRYLPFMDWVKVTAQYKGNYDWVASPLITIDQIPGQATGVGNRPGAVISNGQDRSLNATLNFEKLYSKSKYIKKLDGGSSSSRSSRTSGSRGRDAIKKDDDKDTASKDDDKADRKSKSKNTKASTVEKLFIRPLFSLRNAKFSYRENFSTLVPGFGGKWDEGQEAFDPRFLGLADGFSAPGWDFVAGLQPDITKSPENDNWLYQNREWWNQSQVLNKQIMQRRSLDLKLDVELEPWKNFDVDVEFYKRTSLDHSEELTFLEKEEGQPGDFYQQAIYDVGSVEFSYFTLNTLFGERDNAIRLFNELRENRKIISNRLGVNEHSIDGADYTEGYGKMNNDVVVPAFIAAYTGQNANTIGLDILDDVQKTSFLPKPNWKVKYNGLNKLPWFKDWVKSFALTHGYKSVFSINRFNSDPQYDALTETERTTTLKAASGNYYTRWEIPSIQINEQFNPIIGFDIQTHNDYLFNFEFKKSRLLDLYTTVGELREQLNTEFVFGFGFELEDVNIGFLTGDRKGKKRRRNTRNTNNGLSQVIQSGDSNQPRSLIFDLSMTYSDNITYAHDLRNDVLDPQAVRGTTQFRISPSIEYDISKNLSLRWYAEYGQTTPHVTPPFPVTTFETAFVVRFKLN